MKRPATKSTKSPAAKKATERNLLGPLGAEYDFRGMVEGVKKNGTKGIKKPAAAKKVAKKPLPAKELGEWMAEMSARNQAALQAEKATSDES